MLEKKLWKILGQMMMTHLGEARSEPKWFPGGGDQHTAPLRAPGMAIICTVRNTRKTKLPA